MKNSMKGIGYFIGSVSLTVHYYFALSLLMFLVLCALPLAAFGLSDSLGRARSKSVTWRQILRPPPNVARLSLARSFLFGARDLWFEVPLPFFLRSVAFGLGWPRPATGAALAIFIIVYGQARGRGAEPARGMYARVGGGWRGTAAGSVLTLPRSPPAGAGAIVDPAGRADATEADAGQQARAGARGQRGAGRWSVR